MFALNGSGFGLFSSLPLTFELLLEGLKDQITGQKKSIAAAHLDLGFSLEMLLLHKAAGTCFTVGLSPGVLSVAFVFTAEVRAKTEQTSQQPPLSFQAPI